MKISVGIVGLPNVGKSTLFKALTKLEVNIANYPFATVDPNVGVVAVPDERVDVLAKLSNSRKKVPAVVEFYDIAGLVKGANKGEGLGNQFLTHIRDCKAVVQVLRAFKNPDIIHMEGALDPLRDLDIIMTELALKDLETVAKRYEKAEGEARSGKTEQLKVRDALHEVKAKLEAGIPLFIDPAFLSSHKEMLRELNLLTAKTQLVLINGTQSDVTNELLTKIKTMGADYLIADLSNAETIPELIKKAYEVLGLISFFTTGEDETRAWTITKGAKTPEAAGTIHTDFEKNFIRAEVVAYEKLVEAARSTGSEHANAWAMAKQKGRLRLEGKDYIVQDGDVVVIRHG